MKNYEYILFDVEDGIGVLTINNPKSLNALNRKTLEEVKEVVSSIKAGEVDDMNSAPLYIKKPQAERELEQRLAMKNENRL